MPALRPAPPRIRRTVARFVALSLTAAACSTPQTSRDTPAADSAASPAARSGAPATVSDSTRVRGTIQSVSGDVITVSAPTGPVAVTILRPLRVYVRTHATLSDVTPRSFVGVTSVPQPNRLQRATEIHIFPEELRGTGEGSYPMNGPDSSGRPRTMTNGTVSGARMTNGTVAAQGTGSTLTVDYKGGSQTIAIPPDVAVTSLAPTQKPLRPGATVVVLATKRPDGTLQTSMVVWAGKDAPVK